MSFIKSKQILVTANFNINNNRLTNVASPIDNNDAINKAYFDLYNTTTVDGITDIDINTPQNSDLLAYNNATGDWYNTKHLVGDYTIIGDLYVSGTTTVIDVDNYSIKDNIILLNSGETQNGVALQYAGIEIDRGLLSNYQLVYNEVSSGLVAGEVGSTLYNIPIQNDNGLPLENNSTGAFKIYVDHVSYSDLFLTFDTSDNSTNIYGDIINLSATTQAQFSSLAKYTNTVTISNDADITHKKYVDDIIDSKISSTVTYSVNAVTAIWTTIHTFTHGEGLDGLWDFYGRTTGTLYQAFGVIGIADTYALEVLFKLDTYKYLNVRMSGNELQVYHPTGVDQVVTIKMVRKIKVN